MDRSDRRPQEQEIEAALADRDWERGLELARQISQNAPDDARGPVVAATCLMRLFLRIIRLNDCR